MSGTTSLGIPYPTLADAPNINQVQSLASAVDALLVSTNAALAAINSAWAAYTPVLTATTTNPSLGPSTLIGRYKQIGKTVHYQFMLTMLSGFAVGSGVWLFSLPVAAQGAVDLAAGWGHAVNSSTRQPVEASLSSSTQVRLSATSSNTPLQGSGINGNAWIGGNIVAVSGTYEAA